jgi:hypothetical protein
MLRLILVCALAFAVLVFGLQPAGASGAPWCAVILGGDGDVHWDCHYRSIEECLPNALAGNRGWCNPSPYFVPAARHQNPRRPHSSAIRDQMNRKLIALIGIWACGIGLMLTAVPFLSANAKRTAL